jgi:hypothetical protein
VPNGSLGGDTNAVIQIALVPGPGVGVHVGLALWDHTGSTVRGLSIGGFSEGINIWRGGSHLIAGNFRGVLPTGQTWPNTIGLGMADTRNCTIGGGQPAERNLISGNEQQGLALGQGSAFNVVRGNLIGPDRGGTRAQGGQWIGVQLAEAFDNTIGHVSGLPNVIAYNTTVGIHLFSGLRNRFRANLVHGTARTLDLAPSGPTPNDDHDLDDDPNELQNHPRLFWAAPGANTRIVGRIDTHGGRAYLIEFFASYGCPASGQPEARRRLGEGVVTTNASGFATIDFTFPLATRRGECVTATATTPDGSTSEFAPAVRMAAKGDFDADGHTDLVLREDAANAHRVWRLQGSTRLQEIALPMLPGPEWRLVAIDDFDRDVRDDLLLWNEVTGQVAFQLLGGPTGTDPAGQPIPLGNAPVLPTNWRPVAAADFDHDGQADLVWRNVDSQKIVIWTLFNLARTGALAPDPAQAVNANWELVAAADMNADFNTDLVWYNRDSGNVVLWLMDANVQRVSGQFTNPASAGNANWKVVAAGDYGLGPNGSLASVDLVWRNATSGNLVVWHLDRAGNRTAGAFFNPAAPSPDPLAFSVVGPR